MKRLFFVQFLLLFLLLACSKNNETSNTDKPDNPKNIIELSTGQITIDNNTLSNSFSIKSTLPWEITLSDTKAVPSWLKLEPMRGNAGTSSVSLTILQKNDSYEDREAYITVKMGEISKQLVVTQKRKNALILSKREYSIDEKALVIDVELKANIEYDILVPSQATWISRLDSKGLNTYTHKFSIAANTGSNSRSAKIIFKDKNSTLSDTLSIYQGDSNCLLLSQKQFNLDENSHIINVEVRHNVAYDILMPNGLAWIRQNTTKALTVDKLQFIVDSNPYYDSREAKIIINAKAPLQLSDTLTVRQSPKNSLVISKKEFILEDKGGVINVELKTNINYDIILNNSWISRVDTKGITEYKHDFLVKQNTGDKKREGLIIFKDKNSNLSDTVVVIQYESMVLNFSDRNMNINLFERDTFATFKHNVDYELELEESATIWIEKSDNPFTKALEEKKVYLRIKSNYNKDSREAKVFLKAKTSNRADTLFIKQGGTGIYVEPTLILNTTKFNVSQYGGTVNAKLWTNIPYSKSCKEEWVKSVALKGLELYTETFTVEPNPYNLPREAQVYFSSLSNPALKVVMTIQQEASTKLFNKDSLALIKIFNATNGQGWENKWDLMKPISEWGGITIEKVANGEKRVTKLNIKYKKATGILDVSELEYLKELDCGSNNLEALKVKNLKYLTQINGSYNKITSIELVSLPVLGELYLNGNMLKSFIQSSLNLPNIKTISIADNLLNHVELTNFYKLINLDFNNYFGANDNQIDYFDMRNCESIVDLPNGIFSNSLKTFKAIDCKKLIGNRNFGLTFSDHSTWKPYCVNLRSVDITNCPSIPALYLSSPVLDNLCTRSCTALSQINITTSNLSDIDISGLINLKYLHVSANLADIFKIKGSNLPNLLGIYCNGGSMSSLEMDVDFAGYIDCKENANLKFLNVIKCKRIINLDCSSCNNMNELNLQGMSELLRLHIFPISIKTLNISNCTKLKDIFYISNSKLESLIAKNCRSLVNLDLGTYASGPITPIVPELSLLDVENCTNLSAITVYGNKLSSLNIKNCTSLKRLSLQKLNELKLLDISNLLALESLSCLDNSKLESIVGLNTCKNLNNISCNNNILGGSFVVENLNKLSLLNLSTNKLLSFSVSNCPILYSVNVNNNSLNSITASNLGKLYTFECANNLAKSISLNTCPALVYVTTSEPCELVNYSSCPLLSKSTSWKRIISYDANKYPIYEYLPKYVAK